MSCARQLGISVSEKMAWMVAWSLIEYCNRLDDVVTAVIVKVVSVSVVLC